MIGIHVTDPKGNLIFVIGCRIETVTRYVNEQVKTWGMETSHSLQVLTPSGWTEVESKTFDKGTPVPPLLVEARDAINGLILAQTDASNSLDLREVIRSHKLKKAS